MAKSDRPRRIRTFKNVAPTERLNPASIRRLLFQAVRESFDRSCDRAAREISTALGAADDNRKHRRSISADSVYKVIRDIHTVSYNQLDGLALHHGVPMALILLFTRLSSEIDHSDGQSRSSALTVIEAFRDALDLLEGQLRTPLNRRPGGELHLNYADFLSVCRAYQAKLSEQPRLL